MVRRLRIAAFCISLLLTLFLLIMWLRSCWYRDIIYVYLPPTTNYYYVLSHQGLVLVMRLDGNLPSQHAAWHVSDRIALPLLWRFQFYPSANRGFYGSVYIPYWFLVGLGAISAAAFGRLNRRFSLRAMLIATTVLALFLGAVVILSR